MFVVDPDVARGQELAAHLRPFGYDVRAYPILRDVADKALYRAKAQGRNRVLPAGE